MAKDASELLDVESPILIADTGYYNGTEIKNCVDDGISAYIKKANANIKTKDKELQK